MATPSRIIPAAVAGPTTPQKSSTNCIAQQLPSQQKYFERIESVILQATTPQSSDEQCSICRESCAEPTSECCMLPGCKGKLVVDTQPCRHLFHYCCISRWHHSSRPERNTCPECRCELFVAEPLTEEQIRHLFDEPQPTERIVRTDAYILTFCAKDYLEKLDKCTRKRHNLFRLRGNYLRGFCEGMPDLLLSVNRPVKPVFTQHKNAFVLIVAAIALLLEMAFVPQHIWKPDYLTFINFVDGLRNEFTEEEYSRLYQTFLHDGLFRTNHYLTEPVTEEEMGEEMRRQIELHAKIEQISAMGVMFKRSPWWKKTVWRVANVSLRNLPILPPFPCTDRTLSSLLRRIVIGESPHDLRYGVGRFS